MRRRNNKKNGFRSKKGVFFTIDAMIGTAIIIASLVLISKVYINNPQTEVMKFKSQDLTNVLSNIKIGEINNSYAKELINEGVITKEELNNSVLEEIGILYVKGYKQEDKELIRNITGMLNDTKIIMMLDNEEIFNNTKPTNNMLYFSRLISGVEVGRTITGYTAKASISSIKGKTFDKFIFFGGLEGQGNLSFLINMPSFTKVNQMSFEFYTNSNFSLYLNGVKVGEFPNSNCTEIDNVSECLINQSYNYLIHEGKNEGEIKFSGDLNESFIGGGFFRINFDTNQLNYTSINYDENTNTAEEKEYLIGVKGVINKYSSIYVPGNLTSMKIFINATTSYPFFITLGNTTIYDGAVNNETGNITFTLDDTNLSGKVNYENISERTIPLRIGHNTIKEEKVAGHNADIVLITDLSGSMKWRFDSDDTGTIRDCDDPNLFSNDTRRISVAKCLDKQFVRMVMNDTSLGNRVWLVDFNDQAEYYYSNNKTELIDHIDSYPDDPSGGTCLCCALNEAHNILSTYSNSSRKKFIVLMTDGLPDYCCGEEIDHCNWWWCYYKCDPTGTSTSEQFYSSSCSGGSEDCTGTDCEGPMNSSINAAKRDYQDLNTTIDTVGFGPVYNCSNANYTLRTIAEEGNGTFYASNDPNKLNNIYDEIARTINEKSAAYFNQRIIVHNINSSLYDNSYIWIKFTPETKPIVYGKIPLSIETQPFNNLITDGEINIPKNTTVTSAFVTSYSGDLWTSKVILDNETVFDINRYNNESYVNIGDPFRIHLPSNEMKFGENNITIKTSSGNDSRGGNENDRGIYTLLIPNFVTFSSVEPKAEGCNWSITFEDGEKTNVIIPSNYNGTNQCKYKADGKEPDCTYNNSTYTEDAVNKAVCGLLSNLDPDLNGKLNVKINQNSIDLNILVIKNVPSLWGPARIKIGVAR